jgi:hypothetical protein
MIKHEGDKWVLYSHDGKKKLGEHDTKAEAVTQERAINIRKYARMAVVSTAAAVDTREETLDGVDYLVVPVVALVEGVLHAMNSADPEMVFAEEFTKPSVVGGFNGRPLYYGHPIVGGEPVTGNDPKVWEELNIGKVFHTAVKKNKLVMEAWIDKVRAAKVAPELLERIAAGDSIEISVGIFCESDAEETGEFDGKKYAGAWRDIVPDHLALLVDGDTGACSRDMGCGVRAAKGAKEMAAEKQKDRSLGARFARLMSMFRTEQAADEMSDNDLKRKLYEALRKVRADVNYVEAFVPVTSPTRVVYSCWCPSTATGPEMGMGYQYVLFERSFTLDANGVVTLGDDEAEVEAVLSYEPVVKAAASAKTAQGAPCSCHLKDTRSTSDMNKEQIVKFLETATDCQVKAMSAVIDTPAPAAATETKVETPAAAVVETKVETPAVETKVETPAVAAKAPTFEDLLNAADQPTRDAINSAKQVGNEKRAASVKALKDTGRCELTDAELAVKSQDELDRLVKLAGSAAVNFSAAGGPKAQDGAGVIPAAPDMTAAVKAARGIK